MTHAHATIAVPALCVRELHSGWQLTAAGGPVADGLAAALSSEVGVPAAVPGCVHTDLLAAGLIPDPYRDNNEAALAWIGLVDWTYRTRFEWQETGHDRHDLVFDGLDTVASIWLNGQPVGDTANQHRSYRFDVGALVQSGDNELVVRFLSPVKYANAQSVALGVRQRPYPLPYDAIRKSACSFGWDWGIATFTSGIWRPVRLESWSSARLAEVRVVATPDGDGGRVRVDVALERSADAQPLTLTVSVDGVSRTTSIAAEESAAQVTVELENARRWWPVGYGEQPLSDVRVALSSATARPSGTLPAGAGADASGGDRELHALTRRVGFRTVVWDQTPDDTGTPFTLIVNDQRIFVKGVNWIPDDALVVRVDRDRYERRLRQAVKGNLNLIRVWGGGIYESDDFYDVCDELGLLTWQDFLFACAAYAEEEPLRSEVEAEARDNIVRLADHPSLVLFTGNNENLWGYEDWGWKLRLDGKTWGAYYYYELFPALIDDLAPHVPYSPGSPFSPGGQHPNDNDHGTAHLWEQWNRLDWPTYRDHTPRFVAEFGWQGPPAWTTLTRSISDDPLTPESPGMIVHQKAMEGNVKLTNGLVTHYRVPEDMPTWHWAMQLNQAVAVRTALEHFRSWAPHTMGAIVWQLNDCWPVTSWAAIDGAEREKPLFHALQNAFAPRIVTVQPRGDALAAIIVNDTGADWDGEVILRRLTFDGTELASASSRVHIEARGTATVAIEPAVASADDDAEQLLVAELDGVRGLWFYVEPRDSRLAAPELRVHTEAVPGGTRVTLTAETLVREITLLIDVLDDSATVDKGLITLLPGESTSIIVTHTGEWDAAALRDPRVLRSANQLVAR